MIELMVTVVFVTLGSFLIQGSFLRSADMFGRYSHTLKLMDWMNAQSSKTKESLLYFDGAPEGAGGGEGSLGGKSFSWSSEVQPLGPPDLYSIRYTVRWTESGKPAELKNEQYAYKKDSFLGS